MSLFHRHHEDPHVDSPEDVFSVETPGGRVLDYRRADFDQIFSTEDADEMRRQVGIGWLLIDQSEKRHEIRPDLDGEFPAVTGMHLGGGTGLFKGGETVTVWTLGYLKDGVEGRQHDG